MKKLAIAVLAVLPFVALAGDSLPTSTLKHEPGPKLELSVKPTVSGVYYVSAIISDRTTGKVLATPSMTVEAGAWATAKLGDTGSIAVTVTPSGQGAAYFAEFHRNGGVTDTQSGTLIVAQ